VPETGSAKMEKNRKMALKWRYNSHITYK